MKNMLQDFLFSEEEKKFEAIQVAKPPKMAGIFAYWGLGLLALLIVICFLPWTQNVQSTGTVTALNPQDRPQNIQSTIAGKIDKWFVQEGQFVKKGDTIVSLTEIKEKFFDPQLLMRIEEQIDAKENALSSTRQKAEALKNQIQALQAGLEFSLSKGLNNIVQAKLKVKTDSADLIAVRADNLVAKEQIERAEKLFEQGLISLTDLERRRLKNQETMAKVLSAENKLLTTRNELINAKVEQNSLRAEYLDKISKSGSELYATLSYMHSTDVEISKMNNEFASMQIRSSFYNVTAPQDGFIIQASRTGIGENITDGESIVSIMPANAALAAELFIEPMDLPLMKPGSKVRLQFDGWPALVFSGWPGASFGTFGGVVQVIDNMATNGKYRMLVKPDTAEENWPEAIRVGSGVKSWALLQDVPIGFELWRQLNGFPPNLTENNFLENKAKPTGKKTYSE